MRSPKRSKGRAISTGPSRRLGVAGLLADEGKVLRDMRDRLVTDGASPQGAATALAGWFGGQLASAIASEWLVSGVGPVVDPRHVRWTVHPDLWVDGVDLGASRNVASEHRVVVSAMVEAVDPIIEACARLARVGRPGLWNEVGDGFAYPSVFDPPVRVTRAHLEAVEALLSVPGHPWRARPSMRMEGDALDGHVVLRKGGCCLAFTGSYPQPTDPDDDERAYAEAFPARADDPDYCVTCPRRTFADCAARQRWWRARDGASRSDGGSLGPSAEVGHPAG